MGYSTYFKLGIYKLDDGKLDDSYNHYDLIEKLIDSHQDDDIAYALTSDGESNDYCKWYDHEEDMKSYSQLFPDAVLELSGMGEENGDMWIKYFYNGKMQVCRAIITYPEFEYDKLQ